MDEGEKTGIARRVALSSMVAGGLAFALLGPRPTKRRADGRVVLDYWEKWTGHEAVAMQRVVDGFNGSQDRIFVRYFSMSAIDQKSLVAIAGRTPPDIIGLWNFNIPAFAEAGALLALDEMADDAGISPDRYAAGVWPLLTHDDRLWAFVSTCGSIALYYNRRAFREAGLDRPPRTIDELDAFNERLTVVDDAGGIERMGFIHTEPGWWSWLWGYFFGGSLWDPVNRRATAAAGENVEGYRWVQRLPEKLGPQALLRFQSGLGFYGTPEHPFLVGKVAMTNQGPWLANNIAAFSPDFDYGVAPFPPEAGLYDPSAPIGLLDADVLVIPKGCRHPREAFEFLAYTQRHEVIEALGRAHCKNSPLATSTDAFTDGHPNRYIGVHNAIAASERAFMFPRMRTWPQYESDFNSGMQRMWQLDEAAGDVLADIERRAQDAVDRSIGLRASRAAKGAGA